ncbi:MAG TPA: hypothetical protein VMB74_07040 [Streptosporangiaceae bacterium]|nr:hypothetical protein [Streptosporangiaceae bacterium]
MNRSAEHLEHARKVADAILYEGYLLYPYHQASQKNRVRFQFGVLMPRGYDAVDPTEGSCCQTECLVECPDDAQVQVIVRFLHLQRRTAEPGAEFTSFDEAAEREERVTVAVSDLLAADSAREFHIAAGQAEQPQPGGSGQAAGSVVRQWAALDGVIRLHAERVGGPFRALALRVELENTTTPPAAPRNRDDGLRHALIAAHSLIRVPGGRFVSMTDPPEWAAAQVAACQNTGTWPVLAGPADCTDLLLSSPVILYDHPEVAAESAGDMFDATEIDEILTLRTLALTDAEKRLARATDSRAAELLDRLEDLPPEMLERMHGAIRYLRSRSADSPPGLADPQVTDRSPVPWWDPGSDASVSPETDHIVIDGIAVARDSRVLMRPGSRRADAQDLFLAGREATVEAVLFDVDGQVHLAVTPVDDPAADLHRSHGRFLYFAPDEVEPVPEVPGPSVPAARLATQQLAPEEPEGGRR